MKTIPVVGASTTVQVYNVIYIIIAIYLFILLSAPVLLR